MLPPALPVACSFCLYWPNPAPTEQTVLYFDAGKLPQKFISVDEADFNLAKTLRRGRNLVGQRAVVNVPGQHGGNITLCAAISA